MAKRQNKFPGALDTNLNWGSQEGLEVDRQPEDRFTSDAWDLMESAILALERQGMGYAHSIWDTNLDTGIDTEQAANEDIIRFFTGAPKTERATIDGTVMSIAEDLAHLGDANTYIRFPAAGDTIKVVVGGKDMIDITEVGANDNTFVINETAKDVNFRIEGIGAPNALFVQGSDGKIGMGIAVIPKGGIGAALLALEGVQASVNGPHVQFTTDEDDRPALSFYPWQHDNVFLGIDCYFDSANWKASDADSSFRISKGDTADTFKIEYDVVGVDANITWNDGITLDVAGTVTIPHLLSVTGGQIKFPAGQVPSADVNTLDDYEEGTWTPSLEFGGASVAMAYTTQIGVYTKIGNMVFIQFYIFLSAKGTSAGAATITGLPFTCYAEHFPITPFMSAVSFADYPEGLVRSGSTAIDLYEVTNAGVLTVLDNTNFENTSSVRICASYRI